jgi:hypothetical protein
MYFLPLSKHITSPLQRLFISCCSGNQSVFIVAIMHNKQIQSVYKMQLLDVKAGDT